MNYLKRTITALAVLTALLGLSTILAACNGSAEADSGVSLSQFNALKANVADLSATVSDQSDTIAALRQTLTENGTAGLYLAISHPTHSADTADTASTLRHTLSVEPATQDCPWTLSGHPDTGSPLTSNILAGTSCGYSFNIAAAPTGGTARLQPPDTPVYVYTGATCTGDRYIANGVSALAAYTGGVFFASETAATPNGYADASNYYMLAPNTPLTTVTVVSAWSDRNGCREAGNIHMGIGIENGQVGAYRVRPNDPAVTGVPNAPVPGPVLPDSRQ